MEIKNFIQAMLKESLNEGVEIDHTRYIRSHKKRASGSGEWMFTSKEMGDPSADEMVTVNGSLSAAGKEAAKKLKTNRVYVMESVELHENPFNQRLQKAPGGETLPAPAKGTVEKHGRKFKEGDMVVPHTGPHAGVPHRVTTARAGTVDIDPMVSLNKHKYDNTTIRASHEHLSPYKKPMKEETLLDEASFGGSSFFGSEMNRLSKEAKKKAADKKSEPVTSKTLADTNAILNPKSKKNESLAELAIIKNNRKFSDVKRFDTDKEANAFIEKNSEYGVLHADDGGVYVAKIKNKGAPLK